MWYNCMGDTKAIGIVIHKDHITGNEKAYVGVGRGSKKDYDENLIYQRGAKFPLEVAKYLIRGKGESDEEVDIMKMLNDD